jgi:hypothetical protein
VGCEGLGTGNYYGFGGDYFYNAYPPGVLYEGPSEPDYIPVPPDENTNAPSNAPSSTSGEQDEVVLYLKDGTVYLVSDYWYADNKIHYVTSDQAEHTVDMDDLDLQKTVDVNARRGVTFTLRPDPTDGNAPSEQGPMNPPANQQQQSPNVPPQ